MPGAELHLPAGSAAEGGDPVVVTPESAGWALCGLRVVRLGPGETRTVSTGPDELAVLPLSGGGVTVEADGCTFELEGRSSVFARVTDWAYVPMDSRLTLSSAAGCELALASARATRRLEPAYVEASSVPVEVRGAGPATRQVTNFLTPGAFDGADKLICCELLTPDGNWSSYPPHKHDDTEGSPVWNEEIYYFRIGRAGTVDYAAEGYGFHRTYTHDGSIDATVTVRDGDVFLVPRGYHGPCVAAPGYPMYYLNVMAGPAPGRTFAFVDDPPHAWIRQSWAAMEPDPRVPLTDAEGTVWTRSG
ncbi:MAG TPA: 5-deoxy-glucuronate isomerase [Gaiellaceae bacterium]|nr:5-deoxy-glucuronate isomerase [Gaiellaceae bacterium]